MILPALLAVHLTLAAASPPNPSPAWIARVGEIELSRAELEDRVAGQLRSLEKERHSLFEATLEQWIAERLLELEAARRGITPDALVKAEVQDRVLVTESEVVAFYDDNRQRIQGSRERAIPQVRRYLEEQRSAELTRDLVAALRGRFEVDSRLEPLRFEIDPIGATTYGRDDAKVTLVEFSDFECPACRRLAPSLERLKAAYPEDLRVEFRQFPLRSIHPRAQLAAEASLCAGDQGAFWALHDRLLDSTLEREDVLGAARGLELDAEELARCLDEGRHRQRIEGDLELGRSLGVAGTPTLFLNGRPVRLLQGVDPFDTLSRMIEEELQHVARGDEPAT